MSCYIPLLNNKNPVSHLAQSISQEIAEDSNISKDLNVYMINLVSPSICTGLFMLYLPRN